MQLPVPEKQSEIELNVRRFSAKTRIMVEQKHENYDE